MTIVEGSWWELVEHTDNRGLFVLRRAGDTILSVCDLNLLAKGTMRDEQGAVREDWTQYVYYMSRAGAPWARAQPWRVLDRARKPEYFTPLRLAVPAPRTGMYPLPRLLCHYCGQTALEGTIDQEYGYVCPPVSCRACAYQWDGGRPIEWRFQRALDIASEKYRAAARRTSPHQSDASQ